MIRERFQHGADDVLSIARRADIPNAPPWTSWLVASLAVMTTACAAARAERDLATQVLAAHGGPIQALRRESELRVHYGFPGTWRWRLAYRAPASLSLTLITAAGEQSYVSDGETVRGYADGALLVSEPLQTSPFLTHTRWMAVTSLSALESGRHHVEARELVRERSGRATGRALELVWPDAARFVLEIDADGLVETVSGPIDIPSIGSGRLLARFGDYRRVDGRTVPFTVSYRLNDEALLDEHVLEYDLEPSFDTTGPGLTRRRPPASGIH